jgi:hypothetical protein
MRHCAPHSIDNQSFIGVFYFSRYLSLCCCKAPEFQLEQAVAATAEVPAWRTQGLIQRVDRWQHQPWTPRPDQQRRDQQMQAVERTGAQET